MILFVMASLYAVFTQSLETTLDRGIIISHFEVFAAFVLPLVMAVIIQSNWSRGLQATATFVVAMLVVFAKEVLSGNLMDVPDPILQFIASSLVVFTLTIPAYYGLWKPTGIASGVESATNLTDKGRRAAALKYE